MENYLAAIMGFMVFLFVWNRTIRWIYLIWATIKERRTGNPNIPLPLVLFAHSGPWFLALYVLLAILILSASHRPEWEWFFGGAFLLLPVIALQVIRFWQYRRTKRKGPSRLLIFAVYHRITFICLLWGCLYIPFMVGELFFMQGIPYLSLFLGSLIYATLMTVMIWFMWVWPQVSYYQYMKKNIENEQSESQP